MTVKEWRRAVINVYFWIWQLPQNILGLIMSLFLRPLTKLDTDTIADVYQSDRMSGGISLGKYAFVSKISARDKLNIAHEGTGHPKQSRRLGPLYLLVIGLPSLIWAGLYGWVIKPTKNGYYKFYTEKWADKLAGIDREKGTIDENIIK